MAVDAVDLPVLHAFRPLISPELSIIQLLPQADRVVLVARPKAIESCCPCCGRRTRRVHSHYMRRLADLPWRNRRIVFSSGVGPPRSNPRNRIQDSRSRIMNSILVSLRLCRA